MGESTSLPEFLPASPPVKRVLDYYQLLTPDQANILENQAQHLSYKPRIVILPRDYRVDDLPSLSAGIASAWKLQGDDFLLVLDMNQRQLFGKASSKLASEGVDDNYISNNLLKDNFYPAAGQDNISGALFGTAQALNIRILFNRNETKQGSQALTYSSANSHGAQDSYHLAEGAFAFFAVVVVSLAVVAWFKRKPKKSVTEMRRAREEQFGKMMEELEVYSREHPKRYLAKVMLLALLGYAYIWFAMGLILLGAVLSLLLLVKFPYLAFKLAIPMALAFWLVARSIWLRIPPVEGIRLSKHDHPELFAMIDDIRTRIQAPKIDEVLLRQDLNASVLQLPRLGLFGWNKNYLTIGIPLMQAFSVEEFRGVLAHEMGHLAKNHSADLAWIYSVQSIWGQLMDRLHQEQHFATGLFRNFFFWYIPYTDAYTFPLCREQEYNADQCSIDLVGKETTARALIGVRVKHTHLDRIYWNKISGDLNDVSQPPANAFTGMAASFEKGIKDQDADTWLKESLKQKTDFLDTHPCLTDRLARILEIPKDDVKAAAQELLSEAAAVASPSAAEVYLGSRLPELLRQLDEQWRAVVEPIWKEKYEGLQQFKKDLQELEEKAGSSELGPEELSLLAFRTYQLKTLEEARPLFLKALEKNPEDSALREVFGQALFNEEDAECVEHLTKVMESSRIRRYECSQILCAWYKMKEDEAQVERYQQITDECIEEFAQMKKEREGVSQNDLFKEHDLNAEQVESLSQALMWYPGINRAYLVRKDIKIFPEIPFYILVIEGKGKWNSTNEDAENSSMEELAGSGFFSEFPGWPVTMSKAPKRLKDFIRSEPSTLVLDRAKLAVGSQNAVN